MTDPKDAKILVIDDDRVVRDTIAGYLVDSGFTVVSAENGEEGLALFFRERPDLVLVDIRMPVVSGLEVLATLRERSAQTPVVVVSGTGAVPDVVEALRLGAWDYVTKPIPDLRILEHAVRKALERASLLSDKERYREHLEEEIAERTKELEKELLQRKAAEDRASESLHKLERVLEETVGTLTAVVEVKDPYTGGHQRRVVELAVAIAEEMGLAPARIKGLRVAGLLHDIGKIHVPAEILANPGRLSEPEINLLRTHPGVGFELLKGISFEWPVAEIVLQHHERMNGSGYPRGLSGEQILLEARVLGVADVVEALSSHRPYRPALGLDFALNAVFTQRGEEYDARVVDVCLSLFQTKGFTFRLGSS